jgi:hypothetical protein
MNPLRWVSDPTGRFAKRPHYSPEQLDAQCERIVGSFLQSRYGCIVFPISTDDLTVLLERDVEDLDPYADFSAEEGEIEGVTEFRLGSKPLVRIAAKLTNTPNLENRLSTTLTHEYCHVHFHDVLYQVDSKPASLFDDSRAGAPVPQAHRCKRDSMVSFSERDWMEWQAGYVCGAMLIPFTPLIARVQDFRRRHNMEHAAISEQNASGGELIWEVASVFQTSRDAARVRLLQKKILSSGHGDSLLLK